MPEATDEYVLNDDGTVTFHLGSVTRILKRPTLGEYRRLVEYITTMDEREDDVETSKGILNVRLNNMLEWIDVVCQTLAGEGLPRAEDGTFDEDKLPVWLTGRGLINDLIIHWQLIPNRHGV